MEHIHCCDLHSIHSLNFNELSFSTVRMAWLCALKVIHNAAIVPLYSIFFLFDNVYKWHTFIYYSVHKYGSFIN